MLDWIKLGNKPILSQNLEPNNNSDRCTRSSKEYRNLTVFTMWTINDLSCCAHFQIQKQRLEKVKWLIHSYKTQTTRTRLSFVHPLDFIQTVPTLLLSFKNLFGSGPTSRNIMSQENSHFIIYYITPNFFFVSLKRFKYVLQYVLLKDI